MDIINESKESLRKEIYDFKLLKSQTQKNILEKFEEELRKELNLYSERLKNDLDEYTKLKEQVSSMVSKMRISSEEISKFTEISKNIKKEDFELTRFANQLLGMDKEKLELMKKIDTLEHLISKMRREGR